jgi:hypothetical protein
MLLEDCESVRLTTTGIVILHLPNARYKPDRQIGRMVGDLFVCERSTQHRQNFRTNEGWGFNYRAIVNLPYRILKVIEDGIRTYYLPKVLAVKSGRFLQFKQNGLDKQIMIPRSAFFRRLEDAEAAEQEYLAVIEKSKPITPAKSVDIQIKINFNRESDNDR